MITEGQHRLKCALEALYEIEDRMTAEASYETPLEAEPLKNQNLSTEGNPHTILLF